MPAMPSALARTVDLPGAGFPPWAACVAIVVLAVAAFCWDRFRIRRPMARAASAWILAVTLPLSMLGAWLHYRVLTHGAMACFPAKYERNQTCGAAFADAVGRWHEPGQNLVGMSGSPADFWFHYSMFALVTVLVFKACVAALRGVSVGRAPD